jgi:polar amino acid transport system substrate-binding protein
MHRLFIVMLMGLTLLPVVVRAETETITIVADRWCPYNCEPGSERPGVMIEIAQKAFAKHNISIEYLVLPWTRALDETRKNKYTAVGRAGREDAPDFVFPSVAQGHMNNVFYVKKGNPWRYTDVASLEKVSLGVIADYSYSEVVDAYIMAHKNEPKFVQVITGDGALDINVKKLIAGRIGAMIDEENVIRYYLSQHDVANQVERAGSIPASKKDDLFIAFSPKEPKAKIYANILAKETKEMRKSGELKKILATYNLTDWQK